MPVERDNDRERLARIEQMICELQREVEDLARWRREQSAAKQARSGAGRQRKPKKRE